MLLQWGMLVAWIELGRVDLECILDVNLIEPAGILDVRSKWPNRVNMLLMSKSYSGNFN